MRLNTRLRANADSVSPARYVVSAAPAQRPAKTTSGMGKGGLVTYVNTDFFRIVFRLEGSIFDNIAYKILATFVISLVAAALHESSLKWFSAEGGVPPVNALAYTITGSSIAFLLVFRSVISYNRFWEGRGHLGGQRGA